MVVEGAPKGDEKGADDGVVNGEDAGAVAPKPPPNANLRKSTNKVRK